MTRPPTEISGAPSGSLSWNILDRCLPLLGPGRDEARKCNSTAEGAEHSTTLPEESEGASSCQNTPARMAGMSRNNQIPALLTVLAQGFRNSSNRRQLKKERRPRWGASAGGSSTPIGCSRTENSGFGQRRKWPPLLCIQQRPEAKDISRHMWGAGLPAGHAGFS